MKKRERKPHELYCINCYKTHTTILDASGCDHCECTILAKMPEKTKKPISWKEWWYKVGRQAANKFYRELYND